MSKVYPQIYLYKRIVQAKLFIDTHYNQNIDLNNISNEAYFSKFHFIRLFKTIYRMTPHQYLTTVRIEKAKECLQKEMSVTDACFAVGFQSLSSFTGLFKRSTNVTPSQYQQTFVARREMILKSPLQFIPGCFAEQKGWK